MSNSIYNSNQGIPNNNISNHNDITITTLEKIKIAIHNIQGLNNLTKLQQWISYCAEENLHIVLIAETKLKQSNQSFTNLLYKIFTSNHIPTSTQNREASLGTTLMIYNSIQSNIHNIIYLLSNYLELLTHTQQQINL